MVVCWAVVFVLLLGLAVVKGLSAVMGEVFWFTGDRAWQVRADAAASLADTVGAVSLVSFPVVLTAALALLLSQDFVEPKSLPPWTTREQLRTARVLARNAVMSDVPRLNLLARVYAGRLTSTPAVLASGPWTTLASVLNVLLAANGVFLLVRGIRAGSPSGMVLGLNLALLFSGVVVLHLVSASRNRRMRAFCALYDAAQRRMVR
jgi:hypothetical protein